MPDFRLSARGFSQVQIAKKLKVHKSTISRELSRNGGAKNYSATMAERRSREKSLNRIRWEKLESFSLQVYDWLKNGMSPEQIAGRLSLERVCKVSVQTVYRFIRKKGRDWAQHLRRHGKRGGGRYAQRRGKRSSFISIWDRPEITSQRKRRGDWERDGMYLAERQQLLVLNERKSRYVKLSHMGTGKPKVVTKLTNNLLRLSPCRNFTMTNDNGAEFRDSRNVNVPTYHCDRGRPEQRGTIENSIGLLRQYLPRNTKAETLTNYKLQKIERKINMRPRKVLDYRTPYEVLFGVKVALATRI